mgnify:CR=1 FL=1
MPCAIPEMIFAENNNIIACLFCITSRNYFFIQLNSKKTYTANEALAKAENYCAYQDRCHQEVRSKLIEWAIYGDDLELIINKLIENKFLDEERFAKSYVRGKFRIKKWGRIKIEQELKRRDISSYCIKQGFKEIEEEDYRNTLQQLITNDEAMLKTPQTTNKLIQRLMRKGFEYDLIQALIKQ